MNNKITKSFGVICLATAIFVIEQFDPIGVTWLLVSGILASAIGWRMWSARREAAQTLSTGTIASTVNGYVELYGRTGGVDDTVLRDPIQDIACVWFAVKSFDGKITVPDDVEPSTREIGTGAVRAECIKEASSSRPFILNDRSGSCLIDPADAQFDLAPAEITYDEQADATHVIWRIGVGASISVWGLYRESAERDAEVNSIRMQGKRKFFGKLSKPSDSRVFVISLRTPAQFERFASRKSLTRLAVIFFAAALLSLGYALYFGFRGEP